MPFGIVKRGADECLPNGFGDVIIDDVPDMTVRTKMERRWAADGWDMLIKVKVEVKRDYNK